MAHEVPAELGEHGRKFWESITARMEDKIVPSDHAALLMACKWLDRFMGGIDSDEKGTDIKCGIASDKFLALSAKFGFTPADRKNIGDGEAKTGKKVQRKKSNLDELTPDKLKARGSR